LCKIGQKELFCLEKRCRFLQIIFLLSWLLLGAKLAYEQLYRSALLAGTLPPQSGFSLWMQQIVSLF